MPDKIDPRIAKWSGGRLRVFYREQRFKKTGQKNAEGEDLYEPELTLKFNQEADAKPVGSGFALLQPFSWIPLPGVFVDFDMRNGRLEAVAVRSDDDGPELTQSVLRSIGSPRTFLREHGGSSLVRLGVDERGEIYGIYSISPELPDDARTFEERTTDAQAAVDQATGRPGRPPLPDRELKVVAQVVREARSRREATDRAVAEYFHITLGAAKKRIRIARDRGHFKEEN